MSLDTAQSSLNCCSIDYKFGNFQHSEACGVINTVTSLRELVHLYGCQMCTLSPLSSREHSLQPHTHYCDLVLSWGQGVRRRGEAKEHREVSLDAYQRVKMAGANFWLSCNSECVCVCIVSWHLSRPSCPWLMKNQGGGWVIAFQHLLIHLKSFT